MTFTLNMDFWFGLPLGLIVGFYAGMAIGDAFVRRMNGLKR